MSKLAQAGLSSTASPGSACASFDMFKGYAHRAQVFAEAMQALADERGEVA